MSILCKLIQGDCLEVMKTISEQSVDMVLTDPPYGSTQCKWDVVIDIDLMWIQLKRIVKENGAIVIFGTEPFSSLLRVANLKMFKYDWVWQKDMATNHLNVKKQPMRRNEIISVFYNKQCLYQPQLIIDGKIRQNRSKRTNIQQWSSMDKFSLRGIAGHLSYPNETLCFARHDNVDRKVYHPTEKPVTLLEYLIKTYALENETVLDFTMGSGSTGVACKNLNRGFIGIEKDENYFKIAEKRINEHITNNQ